MALKKVKTLTIKIPAGAIAIDRGDLDDLQDWVLGGVCSFTLY